jgi:hypothetical protein
MPYLRQNTVSLGSSLTHISGTYPAADGLVLTDFPDTADPVAPIVPAEALAPTVHFGAAEALAPTAHFGAAEALASTAHFGAAEALVPTAHLGAAEVLVLTDFPETAHLVAPIVPAEALAPTAHFGAAEALAPPARLGTAEVLVPSTVAVAAACHAPCPCRGRYPCMQIHVLAGAGGGLEPPAVHGVRRQPAPAKYLTQILSSFHF